jgi:hypothetical protein
MKTLLLITFCGLLQLMASARNPIKVNLLLNEGEENGYSLVYSEEDEALVYKDDGTDHSGHEIVIESLPGFDETHIPVIIAQKLKGSFTFKKHPKLELPEYYTVVIEDNLTGQLFDLKAADSYTFSINRSIPDRFVLHITKKKATLTALEY